MRSMERHDETLTDLGNARRLVEEHGRDLRFTRATGWLVWDGRRFCRDVTGEVERRAKATVQKMLRDASSEVDSTRRQLFASHAVASHRRHAIENMISLAKTELPVATTIA